LLLVKIMATRRQRILPIIFSCVTLSGFIVFSFGAASIATIKQAIYPTSYFNNTVRFIKQHAPGKPIYFFFPFVSGAYPFVDYAQTSSASRFPGFIFLRALVNKLADPHHSASDLLKLNAQKQAFISEVLEDFYQNHPELVFIADNTRFNFSSPEYFDYLAFFSSDPRFRKLFAACYAYYTDYAIFKVYKKTCAAY
jgi:hypothetical protein